MTRPMFPHCVDSTMLSAFRSCPHSMFRAYLEHWKPKSESVHLIAGGAFAKGVEVARKVFWEGMVPDYATEQSSETGLWSTKFNGETFHQEAVGDSVLAVSEGLHALLIAYGDFECPPESAKSCQRMCGALEYYFENYPLGADGCDPIVLPSGRRAIEFSFAEPLSIAHPVTGDPILYTGRSDLIANFAGGIYIEDDKTTTSLGQQWARQWEMRSQFTGYCWAAQKVGIDPTGVLVRGVSILKTKYDTQSVPTYRGQWEIDRWEEQTLRDIARMIQCWEDGYWDFSLDHACAEFGGCKFVNICKSKDPEPWLEMNFHKLVWDPLARRQLTVEEWEASWES